MADKNLEIATSTTVSRRAFVVLAGVAATGSRFATNGASL
jgi:hypothetical protein